MCCAFFFQFGALKLRPQRSEIAVFTLDTWAVRFFTQDSAFRDIDQQGTRCRGPRDVGAVRM